MTLHGFGGACRVRYLARELLGQPTRAAGFQACGRAARASSSPLRPLEASAEYVPKLPTCPAIGPGQRPFDYPYTRPPLLRTAWPGRQVPRRLRRRARPAGGGHSDTHQGKLAHRPPATRKTPLFPAPDTPPVGPRQRLPSSARFCRRGRAAAVRPGAGIAKPRPGSQRFCSVEPACSLAKARRNLAFHDRHARRRRMLAPASAPR